MSEPQSGPRASGFGPSRLHLADPGEQLAYALVYRPIAKAHEMAGRTPKHSTRALRDWVYQSRQKLKRMPDGLQDIRTINLALATAGAELLDLGERACLEMEGPAVEAALGFVRTVRRYALKEPEELELAKAYAMNLAIAKAARARLFATGFSFLSATRTTNLDAAGQVIAGGSTPSTAKLTSKLPAGGDLAAIAREHDREARIALLTLRDVVGDRHASSPAASGNAQTVERIRSLAAAHAAAARQPAQQEAPHVDDSGDTLVEHEMEEHAARGDGAVSDVLVSRAHEPTEVEEEHEASAAPAPAPAPVRPSLAWCRNRSAWVPVEVANTPIAAARPSAWAIAEMRRQGMPIDPSWEEGAE